jgi:aryl-alcohol dehydrogenase-like predicted oxidoreductase
MREKEQRIMQYRNLGRTGWRVSEISFGAWAIGAGWGPVDDQESLAALNRAIDLGVNFIDTADVYGDGHSEQLIARVRKERSEELIVATKAGRRLSPHTADGYNAENLTRFVERSLRNLWSSCTVRPPKSSTGLRCLAPWTIWSRPARPATTASASRR